MLEQYGSYTLLRQIGVGGMAEVFLARHSGVEGFQKDIVIKRIRPHLSAQSAFIGMFLQEAKLAAQLSHPNIVQIYDLGKIKDSYFIAMEYIAGRDMSALLPKAKEKGIPFPAEYALKIASNICEALDYAHTKKDKFGNPLNIVHRDVSPENIRIAWTGAVKILDFGIAKAETQMHETKSGEIKGKLSYMSPEQVMGKEVDLRSDVFSMGVVLYEFVTGLKLFSGEADLAIMNNIIDGKIYPPSYFRDDVSEGAERIIMKALEKDRNKRYQSANDLRFDIDSYLSESDFTPSNVHVANFVKQLFAQEMEEEERDRSAAEAIGDIERVEVSSRALVTKPEQPIPMPPPPPRDDSGSFDLPDAFVLQEPSTSHLALTLRPESLAKLRDLAIRRNSSLSQVAQEMLENYLQYI